jgi:hypothetical protein
MPALSRGGATGPPAGLQVVANDPFKAEEFPDAGVAVAGDDRGLAGRRQTAGSACGIGSFGGDAGASRVERRRTSGLPGSSRRLAVRGDTTGRRPERQPDRAKRHVRFERAGDGAHMEERLSSEQRWVSPSVLSFGGW